MKLISLPVCVLHIAVLQAMLMETTSGSVLPRPNYKTERATTQLLNTAKNLSDETVVIVTSSELPKQIPPPPTPTKSQGVTPQYENGWNSKENDGKRAGKRAELPFPLHYNSLESAITFHNFHKLE